MDNEEREEIIRKGIERVAKRAWAGLNDLSDGVNSVIFQMRKVSGEWGAHVLHRDLGECFQSVAMLEPEFRVTTKGWICT